MQVTIKAAVEADKDLIDDMLQAYALDLLQYMDSPRSTSGRFEYPELDSYWREPDDRFPFLIAVDDQTVGFVFVNHCFNLVDLTAWSIEEFYISREFRRRGMGMAAAGQVLHQFPGKWEVAVIESNEPAIAFWSVVIGKNAFGDVAKHHMHVGDTSFQAFTFTIPQDD